MHIVEYLPYIVSFFSSVVVLCSNHQLSGHLVVDGYNYVFWYFIFKTN